jgi:hypothetical protein
MAEQKIPNGFYGCGCVPLKEEKKEPCECGCMPVKMVENKEPRGCGCAPLKKKAKQNK